MSPAICGSNGPACRPVRWRGDDGGGRILLEGVAQVPRHSGPDRGQGGRLRDDAASWKGVETIHLKGFRYDRIDSAITTSQRLIWLDRQPRAPIAPRPGRRVNALTRLIRGGVTDFDPSSHSHLAKVLRLSGNRAGAARVAYDREWRLARAEHDRAMAATDGSWDKWRQAFVADVARAWSWLFRSTFGYGHRPVRALMWLLGALVLSAGLSHQAYRLGQMAPNSDVILASAEWRAAMAHRVACTTTNQTGCLSPATIWASGLPQDPAAPAAQTAETAPPWFPARAAMDWETFSAPLYAVDLVIPVLDTGMVSAWAPSKDRGPWGGRSTGRGHPFRCWAG